MMRAFRKVSSCLCLLVLALPAPPAAAQAGMAAEGRMAAFALGPIDEGAVFTIDLLDDSDLNLRLVEHVKAELRARGYEEAPDADYTLTFDTREIVDLSRDGGGVGSLDVDTLSGIEMHMNLWSSTRDSLLTGRRQRPGQATQLLRMDMTVRENTGARRVVWQGEAFSEMRGVEHYGAFRQIVSVLLDRLGQTVGEASFSMQ
ncbi:MAG: hypothetical protein ACE5Q3_14690 [Alphaproteobacteria bacterium]